MATAKKKTAAANVSENFKKKLLSTAAAQGKALNSSNVISKPKSDNSAAFKYADYSESDAVKAAKAAYDEANTKIPSSYTYSDYRESQGVTDLKNEYDRLYENKPSEFSYNSEALDALYDKITGRDSFSYDVNADALYEQYKNAYTSGGRTAMEDTMGRAAALSGGYSSTYAQAAGQQQYNSYLSRLNDVIPELYAAAYERWRDEGQGLYDRYSLEESKRNSAYSAWRDSVDDREAELSRVYDMYSDERDYDYAAYKAGRDFDYDRYRDSVSDAADARDAAYKLYLNEKDADYDAYSDNRALAYEDFDTRRDNIYQTRKQLTDIAYDAKKQVNENNYNLKKQQQQNAYNAAKQAQQNNYNVEKQAQQNAYSAEKQTRQNAYNTSVALIKAGQTPSAALLKQAGISSGDADTLASYYRSVIASKNAKSSSSKSSSSKSSSSKKTSSKSAAAEKAASGENTAGVKSFRSSVMTQSEFDRRSSSGGVDVDGVLYTDYRFYVGALIKKRVADGMMTAADRDYLWKKYDFKKA